MSLSQLPNQTYKIGTRRNTRGSQRIAEMQPMTDQANFRIENNAAQGTFCSSLYLNRDDVNGLKKYKYSCIDDSLLSQKLLNPFWNYCASNFMPDWLHPNNMTLAGFAFLITFLITVLMYKSSHPGIYMPTDKNVPWTLFVASSVLMGLGHHCDGMDGPQARRLKVSSPVGELLDHGIDSWVTGMIVLSFTSLFNFKFFTMIFVQFCINFTFFIVHWEKQFTGTMYLPAAYNYAMLSGQIGPLLFVSQRFKDFYSENLSKYVTDTNLMLISSISTFYQLIVSVYRCLRQISTFQSGQKSIKALIGLMSVCPFLLTTLLFFCWAKRSPNNITSHYPNTFIWSYMTLLSHLTCHVILTAMTGVLRDNHLPKNEDESQMSTRQEKPFIELAKIYCWDSMMTPVFVSVIILELLRDRINFTTERNMLVILALTITATQIHFATCIFRQMLDLYKTNFFTIPPIPPRHRLLKPVN